MELYPPFDRLVCEERINTKTRRREERRRVLEALTKRHEEVATQVIDGAFRVHTNLGPGLLESVYERCLRHELHARGLRYRAQVAVPVVYEGMTIDGGFRLDILVEELVVLELKAAETMLPVYSAQLLTYLRLSNHRLGLLINFNIPRIKDGIRRVIR